MLRRPSVDTKFHIDLERWRRHGRDFDLYLRDNLCSACRQEVEQGVEDRELDWVSPETGEVRRLNAVWGRLITCCGQQPDFIDASTPLTTAIFRVLLANGNTPTSPVEFYERIGRGSPMTILRILLGGTLFGVTPVEL
jgi:hypothetical protein